VAIDILCDIMQHATLPPDELAKEMDVIRREMDMNVDDPGRRAGRRLFETAYTRSPYRFTIIGYPDIFNELKPEDIRNYYTREIRAEQRLLRRRRRREKRRSGGANPRRLREIQGAAMPPMVLPEEPKQTRGARNHRGSAHRTRPFPFRLAHPGIAPSRRAGAGRAGRAARQRAQFAAFQQVRERQGVVHHVDAWTYSPGNARPVRHERRRGRGQICRRARRDAGRNRKDEGRPVSPNELQKAVKQFISATLSTRKTMEGQAATSAATGSRPTT
jgi:zinc protease